MNKLVTTITIAAFATVACIGGASAMPGGSGNNKPAPQQPGIYINLNAYQGAKGSGPTTSPGDAFYPDVAAVGDPKAECLELGGTPVRISGEYDFYWSCKL